MASEWKAEPRWSSPAWDGKGKQPQHHRHQKSSSAAAAASYSPSWVSKPPLPPDHYSVPLWEKKFVNEVGKKSWKRLLDDQRLMSLMGTNSNLVLNWDDSGAFEAFQNAKARFRAKYFGYNSNILLPDPDMFIDEVDFDASINPELIEDLEKIRQCPVVVDDLYDGGFVDCTYLPILTNGWVRSIPNNNSTHYPMNWDHPIGEPINSTVTVRLENQAGFSSSNMNHVFGDASNYHFVPSDPAIVPTGWNDAEPPVKNRDGGWDRLIKHQTPSLDATEWCTSTGHNSSGWNGGRLPSDFPVVPTGWGEGEQPRSNNRDLDHLIERQTQLQDVKQWCTNSGPNSSNLDASYHPSDSPIVPNGWDDANQNVKGNNTNLDNIVDCRTQVQDVTRCSAASGTNSSGWNLKHGNSYASNVGGAWTSKADQSWSSCRQNNAISGRSADWNTRNWDSQRRNGRKRDGPNWNGSLSSRTKYQDCDNERKSRRRNCWVKKNTDYHHGKT